jgi:hypothetical protein
VETVDLHEEDRVTTMTILIAFQDQASRGDSTAWSASDGVRAAEGGPGSYDRIEDLLATLA